MPSRSSVAFRPSTCRYVAAGSRSCQQGHPLPSCPVDWRTPAHLVLTQPLSRQRPATSKTTLLQIRHMSKTGIRPLSNIATPRGLCASQRHWQDLCKRPREKDTFSVVQCQPFSSSVHIAGHRSKVSTREAGKPQQGAAVAPASALALGFWLRAASVHS